MKYLSRCRARSPGPRRCSVRGETQPAASAARSAAGQLGDRAGSSQRMAQANKRIASHVIRVFVSHIRWLPHLPPWPVLDRLGDVRRLYRLAPCQSRDRARQLKHTVIGASSLAFSQQSQLCRIIMRRDRVGPIEAPIGNVKQPLCCLAGYVASTIAGSLVGTGGPASRLWVLV